MGSEAQKRFLPSRFDYHGFAIDETGGRCESIACPNCRLPVPRILCETWPMYLSVLGAPASGKSYFLASSIWQARQRLSDFQINFVDADPVANQVISRNEKKLFLNEEPDKLVAVLKTETDGELYQMVHFGGRRELFAKPFVFSVSPSEDHRLGKNAREVAKNARALCLYDNAGEHFLPNLEAELSPATSHLALCKALIFVFDPIQHPNFRKKLRAFSSDPQLGGTFPTFRQDEILQEAAKRIRKKSNVSETEKLNKPLIVVVNKFDVWRPLTPKLTIDCISPYVRLDGGIAINHVVMLKVSKYVEQLLKQFAPEIVTTCKAFSRDVIYIPLSPLGRSPEIEEHNGTLSLGVRPRSIEPIWAEVPLVYALSLQNSRLVPISRSKQSSA